MHCRNPKEAIDCNMYTCELPISNVGQLVFNYLGNKIVIYYISI